MSFPLSYSKPAKLKAAARVLGLSRTRDGDLRPMVAALRMLPHLNTAEENERLTAATYALRHWSDYQNFCGKVRSGRASLD